MYVDSKGKLQECGTFYYCVSVEVVEVVLGILSENKFLSQCLSSLWRTSKVPPRFVSGLRDIKDFMKTHFTPFHQLLRG